VRRVLRVFEHLRACVLAFLFLLQGMRIPSTTNSGLWEFFGVLGVGSFFSFLLFCFFFMGRLGNAVDGRLEVKLWLACGYEDTLFACNITTLLFT
jgi:hypothetical protein